jgi:copper chaperone CopZ
MKIIVFLLLHVFAQVGGTQSGFSTTTFWVGGVCDMCKERIETACDVKGVQNAHYDVATQQLTITYSPKKITLQALAERIQNAGHDTAYGRASDAQYNALHSCCRYRHPSEK